MRATIKTIEGVFVVDEDNNTCTLIKNGKRPLRVLEEGKTYKLYRENGNPRLYINYTGKKDIPYPVVGLTADIEHLKTILRTREQINSLQVVADIIDTFFCIGHDPFTENSMIGEGGKDDDNKIEALADKERFHIKLIEIYHANVDLIYYSSRHRGTAVEIENGKNELRRKRDELYKCLMSLAVKHGIFGEDVLGATGHADNGQALDGQSLNPEHQQELENLLPEELKSDGAVSIFQKAIYVGLIKSRGNGLVWKGTKQLLAYFAEKMSDKFSLTTKLDVNGNKTVNWKIFETLFCLKGLKGAKHNWMRLNTRFEPTGFEKVDDLM